MKLLIIESDHVQVKMENEILQQQKNIALERDVTESNKKLQENQQALQETDEHLQRQGQELKLTLECSQCF